MTKWQIARYLIDAKKEVDSLWYIAAHQTKLNCDIRRLIELRRNTFYINAAVVVDKFIEQLPQGTNRKRYKKDLQTNNQLIDKLYQYRDKHAAHKDEEFQDSEFKNLMELVRECISILKEVKTVCCCALPEQITLDFVCYDGNLFRLLYGIDQNLESKIKKSKYAWPKSTEASNYPPKKIFHDTEDLWKVQNANEYGVIIKDGLTLEESVQTRQDAAIKINVLYNQAMWPTPNREIYTRFLMARKLGEIDIFNRLTLIERPEWQQQEIEMLIEAAPQYYVYNLNVEDQEIKKAVQKYRTKMKLKHR